MTRKSLSGLVSAALALLTILATVPTELQKLIMDACPKWLQGYIAIVFAVAAFIARTYHYKFPADPQTPQPPENKP